MDHHSRDDSLQSAAQKYCCDRPCKNFCKSGREAGPLRSAFESFSFRGFFRQQFLAAITVRRHSERSEKSLFDFGVGGDSPRSFFRSTEKSLSKRKDAELWLSLPTRRVRR